MADKTIFIDINDIVKAKVVIQGSNGQTVTPNLKGQKAVDTFTSVSIVAEQIETDLQKEFTTWAKFNWSYDVEGQHTTYNSKWNSLLTLDQTVNSDYRIEFTFYDDITDTYPGSLSNTSVAIISDTYSNYALTINNSSYFKNNYFNTSTPVLIKNRINGEHTYIYNDINSKSWMDGVELGTCNFGSSDYHYQVGGRGKTYDYGWTGYFKEFKLISNSTSEVICDIKSVLVWQNGEDYQKISALYDTINDKIYYVDAIECMNEIKQDITKGYLKSYCNYGKFSYEERVLATYKELTDIAVDTNHQLILNFYDDTSKECSMGTLNNQERMVLANSYSNPSGYFRFDENNYHCCAYPHDYIGTLVPRSSGHHTFIYNNENNKFSLDGIELGTAQPVNWNYYQLGSQLFETSDYGRIAYTWYLESFQIISKTTGDLVADIVPALRWKEDEPSKKEYCLYDRARNIYYIVNNLVCMNSID